MKIGVHNKLLRVFKKGQNRDKCDLNLNFELKTSLMISNWNGKVHITFSCNFVYQAKNKKKKRALFLPVFCEGHIES